MKDYIIYLIKYVIFILFISFLFYLILPANFENIWINISLVSFGLLAIHLAHIFSLRYALQFRYLSLLKSKFSIWQDIIYFLQKFQKRHNNRYQILQLQFQDFLKAIEASPNGVILLDNQGYIKWINARSQNLLNISKKDKGQLIQHLIRYPEFINYWNSPYELGIKLKTLNNTIQIKILRIDEDNLLFLAQDITQKDKLEEMHKEFIANISHELSTPLSSILGFSETLLNLNLDEEHKIKYLTAINDSALHMKLLVKDLLLITQIDNTSVANLLPLNLFNLLNQLYQYLYSNQRVIFDEVVEKIKLLKIMGIEKQIKSVFINLIDNAIKYSKPDTQINIGLYINSNHKLCFYVKDKGIGIKQQDIEQICKRFYRVSQDEVKNIEGTGLGLAIVEQILHKHNTNLNIKSEFGKGSCFSIAFEVCEDNGNK